LSTMAILPEFLALVIGEYPCRFVVTLQLLFRYQS
jgi:hypothetical protein